MHARWACPWSVSGVVAASMLVLVAEVGLGAAALDGGFDGTLRSAAAAHAGQDQQALDRRLPMLWAFLEQERGLAKRRDVPVEVLDDEAFDAALDAGAEMDPDDPTAVALGLDSGEGFDGSGVLGFYSDIEKRVLVRDDDTDMLDQTVVHELTHALQDQWFGLGFTSQAGDSENALAFDALVEGDATRVERAWYAARPAKVRAHIDAIERERYGATVTGGSGRIEAASFFDEDFPYVAGRVMVEQLLAKGGQQLLDETFRTPPLNTAQVLHPELIGAGYAPSPPPPSGPGELVDSGTLGELGLAMLLGEDPMDPDAAEVGWQGDSYRTYETGDDVCLYARVDMVDADSREDMVAAVRALDDETVRASPAGPLSLTLSSCEG